jgi:hypothetical protein
MSTRTQTQMEWGTATEITVFAGAAREPVWDTTNLRIVVMLGTGAGNFAAMASEAYVQVQIAALTAGNVQNLFNASTST